MIRGGLGGVKEWDPASERSIASQFYLMFAIWGATCGGIPVFAAEKEEIRRLDASAG